MLVCFSRRQSVTWRVLLFPGLTSRGTIYGGEKSAASGLCPGWVLILVPFPPQPDGLLIVYRCTRTHSPHPPPRRYARGLFSSTYQVAQGVPARVTVHTGRILHPGLTLVPFPLSPTICGQLSALHSWKMLKLSRHVHGCGTLAFGESRTIVPEMSAGPYLHK